MMFLWVKALHLIFVITWFAGIFYLPRLFVYHAMAKDAVSLERFTIMERKLYRGIMMPSMILTVVFGSWLIFLIPDYFLYGWLHVKLGLVALVIIYHFWCGHLYKQFRDNQNRHSHVWYRWFNEIPVIALFAIVILVVVKPF